MPPAFSFSLERYGDRVTIVTFCLRVDAFGVSGRPISSRSEALEDEEQLRQLAVHELTHRLKNKIATIQAIISVQLRDQPQVRACAGTARRNAKSGCYNGRAS